MATQTRDANGWTQVHRSGDERSGDWGSSPTALNTADGNILIHVPFRDYPPPPPPGDPAIVLTAEEGCNSPILRVSLAAFSLPPTDIIVSAFATVRHGQIESPVDGGTIVFENNGTTLANGMHDESYLVNISGLSIAALNAGTATLDLLYHGVGMIPVPLDANVPATGVDHVTLTVTTMPQPSTTKDFDTFRMTRIPEIGVR